MCLKEKFNHELFGNIEGIEFRMACSKVDVNGIIVKESIMRYAEIFMNQGVSGLRKELNEHMTVWQSTKLLIAVTGASKTGKSTFINALLNLNEDDRAEDGEVDKKTAVRSFVSAHSPNVMIDDLPGVGTSEFPKETYISDVELDKYMFYIIIAKKRFTDDDYWLAKEIKKMNKQFYFVRTHLQNDIDNDKRAHPKSHQQQKVVRTIRNDCESKLKEFENKNIFLVDSFQTEDFDFPLFVETLLRESGEMKATFLASSLAIITQNVLKTKLKFLKQRLFSVVFLRVEYHPMSFAERQDLIGKEINYYRKVFDVDEEKLKNEALFNLTEETAKKFAERLIENNDDVIKYLNEEITRQNLNFDVSPEVYFTEAVCTTRILEGVLDYFYKTALEIYECVPGKFAEKCSL